MARPIYCQAISLGAFGARLGIGATKAALDLAFLPPEIALKTLGLVKGEADKVADRANKGLSDISNKCNI